MGAGGSTLPMLCRLLVWSCSSNLCWLQRQGGLVTIIQVKVHQGQPPLNLKKALRTESLPEPSNPLRRAVLYKCEVWLLWKKKGKSENRATHVSLRMTPCSSCSFSWAKFYRFWQHIPVIPLLHGCLPAPILLCLVHTSGVRLSFCDLLSEKKRGQTGSSRTEKRGILRGSFIGHRVRGAFRLYWCNCLFRAMCLECCSEIHSECLQNRYEPILPTIKTFPKKTACNYANVCTWVIIVKNWE